MMCIIEIREIVIYGQLKINYKLAKIGSNTTFQSEK